MSVETGNEKSGGYAAGSWDASIADLREKSERRAWMVAKAACVVAVACAAAFATMMPFYRVVPIPIQTNMLTGDTQVIDVLDAAHVPASVITDKHWIETYVQSRERYNWGLLQFDYDRVLNWSSETVAHDYAQIYNGPDALDRKLGRNTEKDLKIISTTLPPGEAERAVLHIMRTTRKNGVDDAEPPECYVVTLRYEYRPPYQANGWFSRLFGQGGMLQEGRAVDNPYGFKVTAYSRDAEHSVQCDAEEQAIRAAAAAQASTPHAVTFPIAPAPQVQAQRMGAGVAAVTAPVAGGVR